MNNIKILSALLLSGSLVACGGSPKSASDKPDSLFPDGYIPVSSVASTSSSIASGSSSSNGGATTDVIKNTQLPILEDFNNAVDGAGFFSKDYKPLASDFLADPDGGFYYPLAGLVENRIMVGQGKLTIGNGRFSIGQTYYAPALVNSTATPANPKISTTQGLDTTTWGELDLSKNYKISMCVVATSTAGLLQIYVDNNTTALASSIHTASRIFSNNANGLIAGKRLEINIPGDTFAQTGGASLATKSALVGSSTSFLQIRADSSAKVTIDDLWIGYQDDLSTEPAASTCVAGEHLVAPATTSSSSSSTSSIASSAAASSVSSAASSAESSVDASASSAMSSELSSVASSASSSSSLASSSSSQATSTSALLVEDFASADATNFFTAAYKANPVDSSLPLYVATSGATRITFADGALSMSNARFSLGDKSPATATAAGVAPNGGYDLSQKYRVKFTVTAFTGTGNFQVYVDNNTTSAGSSYHSTVGSTASRLLQVAAADLGTLPHEVVIESEVGTATSFFQFRADSSVTNITIDNMTIEYQ